MHSDAQQGGGVKAAAKAAKVQRRKGPEGAKSHTWQPKWLKDFPWLRTEPMKTQREWEEQPNEGPDCMYCVCCVEFPGMGHKDVLSTAR